MSPDALAFPSCIYETPHWGTCWVGQRSSVPAGQCTHQPGMDAINSRKKKLVLRFLFLHNLEVFLPRVSAPTIPPLKLSLPREAKSCQEFRYSLLPPVFWNILCSAAMGRVLGAEPSRTAPDSCPPRESQKQHPYPHPVCISWHPITGPDLQPDVGLLPRQGRPPRNHRAWHRVNHRPVDNRGHFHLARHFDIRPVSPARPLCTLLGLQKPRWWEDCGKVLSGNLCVCLTPGSDGADAVRLDQRWPPPAQWQPVNTGVTDRSGDALKFSPAPLAFPRPRSHPRAPTTFPSVHLSCFCHKEKH